MDLVIGVDAGGTGTRAVLFAGEALGRGAAGPGNPCLTGVGAVAEIAAAVREALGTHAPARVAAMVVGLAGDSALDDPAIRAAFAASWRAIGLRCPVELVGDAVTAFAAGCTARSGAVLIAGTGAVAARVDGLRVTQVADGLGFLLGDEGSGAWMGLQAVRAAARSSSPLGDAVLAHAGVRTREELPGWAGRQTPSGFAALAPIVCGVEDPAARAITDEAANRLLATLSEVDRGTEPVVLAGGLLVAATPVRARVCAALGNRARMAGDPALGAASLAGSRLTPNG
jgi:glucosamine kinase